MSTEQHKTSPGDSHIPLHEDVSFEPRDVSPNPILRSLLYLGIFVVASYFLVLGVYRGLTRYFGTSYPEPVSVRTELGATMPPEPRLQGVPGHLTDPQEDLREKIKEDTDANNKLGWVDRKNGIAQIPVKDAMKLIVEKGLSAVPAPPAEKKK